MKGGDEMDRANFNSIYGALFFGVPNRGIRIEHWLLMVNGQPNESLVKKLRPGSKYLRELSANFNAAFTFPDSKIISIYETEKTRTARVRDRAELLLIC
jgi:protein SERAC1